MTARRPLPASSPALADGRFHAYAYQPNTRRAGSWTPVDANSEGRFIRLEDAVAWADEVYPDAPLIVIDRLRAATGWSPTRVAERRDGTWS